MKPFVSAEWHDAASSQPPDGVPVLAYAQDPRGGRFLAVMRYEEKLNRWTSFGSVAIYWSAKSKLPPPHWTYLPPTPAIAVQSSLEIVEVVALSPRGE